MVSIQETDIRAGLDLLEVDPPNTNLPSLDERQLAWVYPVPEEFIALSPIAVRSDAVSINGTGVIIRDDGLGSGTLTFDLGTQAEIASEGRYYSGIEIALAGGTVNPIEIRGRWLVVPPGGGTVGYRAFTISVPNPGEMMLGPWYLPPRVILEVQNLTNGGAGDTMTFRGFGYSQPRGTSVPMIPAIGSMAI